MSEIPPFTLDGAPRQRVVPGCPRSAATGRTRTGADLVARFAIEAQRYPTQRQVHCPDRVPVLRERHVVWTPRTGRSLLPGSLLMTSAAIFILLAAAVCFAFLAYRRQPPLLPFLKSHGARSRPSIDDSGPDGSDDLASVRCLVPAALSASPQPRSECSDPLRAPLARPPQERGREDREAEREHRAGGRSHPRPLKRLPTGQ